MVLLAALLVASAARTVAAQCTDEATASAPARQAYHPGVDVLDYELLIDLPDTGSVIEGRALLTLRRTAPVDTLRLDLLDLRVDSVLVGGVAVPFRRDSARVVVPLGCGAGDTLLVAVRYGGAVRDGLVVRTDARGRWTGFGDNWPNRARHWIPSVDHPGDKATVSWVVIAPSDRAVVANGVLREQRDLGPRTPGGVPRRFTRWRMEQPISTYLMVIGAARMVRHDLGDTACGLAAEGECVPQEVWVAPELADYLPGPFALAGEMTEFFARMVAPFPYARLAHLQSATRFGGMENATAIFYSDRAFRERNVRPGLIAHEVAHQWFGNTVTPRDWPHLWLSEGFASYLEPLWLRKSQGDSAFRRAMSDIRRTIIASAVTAQRPVIDTSETDLLRLLNTNSYQKGAWVLHMLRATVGDSGFFQGVRSYYNRHRHGNADSDDLRRAIEEATGTELRWFFDQWLRRPGHAELTTRWEWDQRARTLTLEVVQGERFAPYRFPLTVVVVDRAGATHRHRVDVSATGTQRIAIPIRLDVPPTRIVLDPDVELLATFRER